MGSLFSGIGGIDLGFERAGFEVAWQCEIDPHSRRVLAHHWPDVECYPDVSEVDGRAIEPVDIITFGSPCQDLSTAGQRAGIRGARSSLFFEATRIIAEMREATNGRFPTIALWENVPGALSSARGADFGAALDALAESGAVDIAWRVIDAQHWVPQRRRRVFTLALYPPLARGCAGVGRASQILLLGQGVRRDTPPGGEGQVVAGTLNARTGRSRSVQEARQGLFVIQPTLGTSHGPDNLTCYVPDVAGALNSEMYHHGGVPNQTLRAPGHLLTSEMGVRRLTPIECCRLQGFPDDWLDLDPLLADTHKYRQAGNAVCVPVAGWIGDRIMASQWSNLPND